MYKYHYKDLVYKGPSCSRTHGSWIHNYLCNQCISSL